MKFIKKSVAVLLCVAILAGIVTVATITAGAVTLYWPVPGHKGLSRDFAAHGYEAIDICDGGINGADVIAAIGGEVIGIWKCPYNHLNREVEYNYGVPYVDPEYDAYGPACCHGNGHGLLIQGDDGRYYNYAHMQSGSIPGEVYYGARVNAGQRLGKVGCTGNATGPHLHFRISGQKYADHYNPMNESYTDNPPAPLGIDMGNDFYGLILNAPAWKTIGQLDNCNVAFVGEKTTTYDKTLWHFQKLNNDNAYKISSLINGRVLDVADASSADGANVWTYTFHDHPAQYWYYKVVNGRGVFVSGCSDKYLDAQGGSTAEGNNVQMWTSNNTDAQSFTVYQVTQNACGLDYTISAKSDAIDKGASTQITVGGKISYVYNYKFHVINPKGEESVIDNGCNPVLDFKPQGEGQFTVYAEIKNPYFTQKGSSTSRCVKIDVGCSHVTTDKFVPADKEGGQGYVLRTCTKCGETFKENYSDFKEGWYYPVTGALPDVISKQSKDYTIKYKNYYEKIQKDSPGTGWVKKEVVKNEWVNKGGTYESFNELPTSDSRVLVSSCYYHWCIPGGAKGSEGNYEQSGNFSHYDSISLPNDYIHVKWQGDDNGHPVYVLAWSDGNEVYCKSGEQCDGSWGYHDYRCRAWYKKYVYQDREKVELYRWVKESDWTDSIDSSAKAYSARFQPVKAAVKPGDVTLDGAVTIKDATEIQFYLAYIKTLSKEQLEAADVNKDNVVNITDATNIQRYLAGYNIKLG